VERWSSPCSSADAPFRNRREFGVPAAAVENSDADAECYDREFYFTDVLWQTSQKAVRRGMSVVTPVLG
jgi:hypothetical protein